MTQIIIIIATKTAKIRHFHQKTPDGTALQWRDPGDMYKCVNQRHKQKRKNQNRDERFLSQNQNIHLFFDKDIYTTSGKKQAICATKTNCPETNTVVSRATSPVEND